MKKTLYLKFLLAYFIFGIFGFIVVSTFSPGMVRDSLVKEKAEQLFAEANLISKTYASELYNSEIGLETVKDELDALSVYMDTAIQIVNPSGRVVLNSQRKLNVEEIVMIENFDPTITGNSYYVVDRFFDTFDRQCLNVIAPINSDFKVKGYVTMHYPMNKIDLSMNRMTSIFLITFLILFFQNHRI